MKLLPPLTQDDEAAPLTQKEAPLLTIEFELLRNVEVDLQAQLGRARLSVRELLDLKSGSVVPLDRAMNEPIEVRLNGAVVALGEIVAVGDKFGVRITAVSERT